MSAKLINYNTEARSHPRGSLPGSSPPRSLPPKWGSPLSSSRPPTTPYASAAAPKSPRASPFSWKNWSGGREQASRLRAASRCLPIWSIWGSRPWDSRWKGLSLRLPQPYHFGGPVSHSLVENRTKVFDNQEVRGSEFLRPVKTAAKRRKLATAGTRNVVLAATARFISAGDSLL